MPYWRAKRMMSSASWYMCTAAISADRDDGAGLILVEGRVDAFEGCSASQMAQRRLLASLSTMTHDMCCTNERQRDALHRRRVRIYATTSLAT